MMMPLGWVGGDQVKVVLVGLVVMVGGERPSGSEWVYVCVGGMHRHYIIMTYGHKFITKHSAYSMRLERKR